MLEYDGTVVSGVFLLQDNANNAIRTIGAKIFILGEVSANIWSIAL